MNDTFFWISVAILFGGAIMAGLGLWTLVCNVERMRRHAIPAIVTGIVCMACGYYLASYATFIMRTSYAPPVSPYVRPAIFRGYP